MCDCKPLMHIYHAVSRNVDDYMIKCGRCISLIKRHALIQKWVLWNSFFLLPFANDAKMWKRWYSVWFLQKTWTVRCFMPRWDQLLSLETLRASFMKHDQNKYLRRLVSLSLSLPLPSFTVKQILLNVNWQLCQIFTEVTFWCLHVLQYINEYFITCFELIYHFNYKKLLCIIKFIDVHCNNTGGEMEHWLIKVFFFFKNGIAMNNC